MMWGVRIDAESRKDIVAGEQYAIRPVNASEIYKWSVDHAVTARANAEQ